MSTPPVTAPSPYRWIVRLLALLVAAGFVYRFSQMPSSSTEPKLPFIRAIPTFSLTERSGKTITNRELAGKVWVADFIYTTCPGPCPIITAKMAALQKAVASDPHVQFVSFSVDPKTDTPAVLSAYADKFGADPDRWWFLTGPEKPLYELIQDGFLQSVVDNRGQTNPDQFIVTHSVNFVLVDANGNMRGSYESNVPEEVDKLLRDIKVIEKEQKL